MTSETIASPKIHQGNGNNINGSKTNFLTLFTRVAICTIVVIVACFTASCNFSHKPNNGKSSTSSSWSDDEVYLNFAGSNTIGNSLMPALVKAYFSNIGATSITETTTATDEKTITAQLNGKNVSVKIAAHGTKTGFNTLDSGQVDICMASDEIDDGTNLHFRAKYGADMRSHDNEHVIGLDGISVIVNAGRQLSELSFNQLHSIFTGETNYWAGNDSITLYRPDNNSGTCKWFQGKVMNNQPFDPAARTFANLLQLTDSVANNPNGIGFVSYSFAIKQSGINIVAIKPDKTVQSSLPTKLTIKSERYPLSRRLFLYTLPSGAANNTNIRPFLNFVISKKAQDIVEAKGFISLAIEQAAPTPRTPGSSYPAGYESLSQDAQKLSVEFRFRFGSSELDPRAIDDIDRLVEYMGAHGNRPVTLVGFADNVGSANQNIKISRQRAEVVAAKLTQKGVNVKNVLGFGDALPVFNNANPFERSFNRRVEVWIQ